MAAPQIYASLDQQIDVETPEQVVLSYTVAGIGSRTVAAIIDYGICAALIVAIWIAVDALGGTRASTPWLTALMLIGVFAVNWGYYVLFEALWDGQTPGKRRMGLRVVRDGGFSITSGASAVRNLVRAVDMQPGFFYGVGILSAILSRSGKRLGDYAAGTFVVRERTLVAAAPASAPSPGASSAAASTSREVVPTALLSDDEFSLLERFVQRRQALEPERRAQFTGDLATRFRARMPAHTGSDPAFLIALFESERAARARGAAAPSDTGAAREQHALVAEGAPRWREFAARLTRAQQRGLAGLPEQEVSDFAARYRELTTDLARLTTAARGREVEALLYLNRLVAAGHNLLYRERPVAARSIWRYVTRVVPDEVRRSAGPIGLAALLMFGPGMIAYVAVIQQPEIAARFIPPEMIQRAENGVERARNGDGYVPDPGLLSPVWASSIIANNVQVTYEAFAGGIFAGLGTVAVLVGNGIDLGGVLGLYQSKGILPLILAFVAPHGILELTAICIAGGGGLLLGSALLIPGALTRREALVERGRRAINLVAAATLLLIPAGLLEGFVSPQGWWTLDQKLIVSGLTAVALVLYLNFDRGRDRGHQAQPLP
ncbi:MAG TPA: stage II sporulation protein M [Gemmatimonadaceae bacterium]|nr:stage II sporulation protein M [Gemmatimonadaceae bacterium]